MHSYGTLPYSSGNVYLSNLRAWTTLPIQIIWIKQSFELSSECQEPIGNKNKTVKASSIICSFKKRSIVKWNKLTEDINKVHSTFPFARAWRWWLMWPYISGETLHLPRGSLTAASKPEATNTNSGSNCKKQALCAEAARWNIHQQPKLWLASSHQLKLESLINFRRQFTESTKHPCT